MRRRLLGMLLAGLAAVAAGAAETNELWFGAPWPPGSKARTDLAAAVREIARQSSGRVQVKIAEQEGLAAPGRTCAGALLAGPHLARLSPSARIRMLPLLVRSAAEAEVLQARLGPAIAAEMAAAGLETLGQPDFGFAYLQARMPLEPEAGLAGWRLWVPPAAADELAAAAAWGLEPVPLAPVDVRAALHAGALDAVVVPPLGAILMQWHVELKWVLDVPLVPLGSAVVLRREVWEQLEPADREVVRAALARVFATIAADLRGKEAESLEVLVRSGGVRQSLADPAARAVWEEWGAGVADRLAGTGYVSGDSLAAARAALAELRR